MTTTTTTPTARLDVSGTPRVPFSRLVRVEGRKMVDTRGGFWLLLITGLLLLLAVGLVLLVVGLSDTTTSADVPDLYDWAQILTIPLSILLPVIAILTVTSEWSQRTGLVTFTLEPHRGRVLLAKFTTVILLALATLVVSCVLGLIGNAVGGAISGVDPVWSVDTRSLVGLTLVQLLYFVMAFALATLVLSTPGSIAVFYVVALLLPLMVYSFLYAVFGWARDLIPWIDLQYATAPFLTDDDLAAVDYARVLTAVLLWIVAPLALGVRRILRSEPK